MLCIKLAGVRCGGGIRGGDDDLGVDELLVEFGVLALLVRGGDESVALVLEPLADAQLVLGGAQEFGDLLGVLAAVVEDEENFDLFTLCGQHAWATRESVDRKGPHYHFDSLVVLGGLRQVLEVEFKTSCGSVDEK